MNRQFVFAVVLFAAALTGTSCKKNRPSEKIDGTYTGHFEGMYEGNDTIVNEGYKVTVSATDKNNANITSSMFSTFEVLVTNNGLNVELVSPTDGLSQFLYEGETKTLSFTYTTDAQNTATYVGTK
jgi:hypothetical protein